MEEIEGNKFLGLQTDNTVIPHSTWGVVGVIMVCWAKLHCTNVLWKKQDYVNTKAYEPSIA